MSDQSIVGVTQADRMMAAHIGKNFAQWTERQIEITLAGEGDEYPMVQSVARHRIAEREACAMVAERIGECANTSGRSGCCETTGDDIAAAIRARS